MNVKVLSNRDGSAVIAWQGEDGAERGILPSELVKDDIVEDALLPLAIPYGLPWEDILEACLVVVTPAMLATELRRYNIWTYQDLTSRAQEVYGAIAQAYAVDYHALMREAKKYQDK